MSTPSHDGALSREQTDILELLAGELQEQLEAALDVPETPSETETSDRLERMATELENLEHAAQLIGLTGLAHTCIQLRFNLTELAAAPITESQQLLIDSWPVYLLDYVQQLQEGQPDEDSASTLLGFLGEETWPAPMPEAERAQLKPLLLNPDWSMPDEENTGPPTEATLSMLSLSLNEDLNPSLFEGLVLELPQQIQQFSRCLEQYSDDGNTEALAQAQRIAHTVKGSANVVGVTGLANFMHCSEDLLALLERESPQATRAQSELLSAMADTLAALSDHLLDGTQPGEEERAVLQEVLDYYHQLASGEAPAAPVQDLTEEPLREPASDPTATPASPEPAPETANAAPADSGPAEETATQASGLSAQIRVEEERIQGLLTLAGEATIGNHRVMTQTQRAQQSLKSVQQLQNKLVQLTDELGDLIEVRNLFARAGDSQQDEIDPLELDRYNELHSFFHQLQEFSADSRDLLQETRGELSALEELTQYQQTNHRESQSRLLDLLTLPAQVLEPRLQRCVRQACRMTGKRAHLTVTGADTHLDSQTLQRLTDPLMHLLRNAVDHGIESADERERAGKPDEGQIWLSFRPEGQATLIEIRDDGGGLNQARIAERAQALNLSQAETQTDDQWLQSVIFLPGFSTREAVSQTSGRGLGLDAVAEQIRSLKGQIQISSEPQAGTQFRLSIPNTLIAEHQLLVRLGDRELALSARGVNQVLFMDPEHLSNRGDRLFYQYQGQTLPVLHLAQIAPLPDPPATDTRRAQALLLVETSDHTTQGLLVDRILASREMVIKPLPRFTPALPGILGATILGDGRVAPVLDTRELLEQARAESTPGIDWLRYNNEQQQQRQDQQRPLALVIDDSLSSRRSLAQFVGDMGMEVLTARDGFEAIEKLQERQPTLVLVDMEMPRMNGLEFTAHLRAQERLRDIPVIMITSRNTEKHRQMADAAGVDLYLNKPFSEDELMHSIEQSLH